MTTPIEPIVFEYESARCELLVWGEGDLASLSEVRSSVKGAGHGTGLLNKVIDYADKNCLKIASAAEPFGCEPGSLNLVQLMDFYKKFGFIFTSDDPENTFMERKPNP